jgi:thioredoxin-related protein
MRKSMLIFLIGLAFLSSCGKGSVKYSEELAATAKFHHREHKSFIDKHGCIPCHKMNVKMSFSDIEAAERGSKKIIMPSKVTCHYCHNNPGKTPAPNAPTQCYICHFNMKEIEPADHKTGNWLKTHKFAYEGKPKKCSECNRQRFLSLIHI